VKKFIYLGLLLASSSVWGSTPFSNGFSGWPMPAAEDFYGGDFLVNDDYATANQNYPAVAYDGAGNYIVAWQDSINGNWDIYAQRFDSEGIALGLQFKVNVTNSEAQQEPAVAADDQGNFVVVWHDDRNNGTTNWDIYAQRYNSSGVAQGANFRVNDDDASGHYQFTPWVSLDTAGNFVVAWIDYKFGATSYDIFARRFNSSGTALATSFKVNTDTAFAQYQPHLSHDAAGNFVIAWWDEKSGNADIYAQRYDASGTAQGVNFKVNDNAGTSFQGVPSISTDGSGNFVIGWEDWRNGNADVYAQRYDATGTALGANFKVNDNAGTSFQGVPAMSADTAGNFLVSWDDWRSGNSDIYARRYNSSGTALGASFLVNPGEAGSNQYSAAVAMGSSFMVVWQDSVNGHWDIYGRLYDDTGSAKGAIFKVNYENIPAEQYDPDVALDSAGNYVIVWADWRNESDPDVCIPSCSLDVYGQRYSSSGAALGANFKVNTAGTFFDIRAAVSSDAAGNFVITWMHDPTGFFDVNIYAQRYSSAGAALDTNFKVNTDGGGNSHFSPAISSDAAGDFVITWWDDRNGNSDIFAQRYSSAGTALDTNFKVNTNAGTSNQIWPAVSSDTAGNFVICWEDFRNGNYDIYAQRYSSSGAALDTNFRVNTDAGSFQQHSPAVSGDADGNFVIVWIDRRKDGATHEVYAQRYSSTGAVVDTNFRVNTDAWTGSYSDPAVSSDANGNFVICWNDIRNGNADIFVQRYSSSGALIGTNLKVNTDAGTAYQNYPAVSSDAAGNLVITWEDRRNGVGNSDIYARWLETSCSAKPGDANASGTYSLSDVISIVNYIFNKPGCSPQPLCWISSLLCRGDWDGSTTVSLSDVIRAVNFIFNKPNGPWNPVPVGVCCL